MYLSIILGYYVVDVQLHIRLHLNYDTAYIIDKLMCKEIKIHVHVVRSNHARQITIVELQLCKRPLNGTFDCTFYFESS